MERFAKIVNGFQSLTIFAKYFILDAWQGSEYAYAYYCLNSGCLFYSEGTTQSLIVTFCGKYQNSFVSGFIFVTVTYIIIKNYNKSNNEP